MSTKNPKTRNDLLHALLTVCPTGSMEEDNHGQLVFYTDLRENKRGSLRNRRIVPFHEEQDTKGSK